MSAAPRVVGRYVLHAEIAAGGMATVHVGRLMGPVGFSRTVAIKRLHPQFAKDPEFVAMFLDEARLAARIRHPNVVSTIDVVAEGGELFLVMDYIEGESLSRLIGASRRGGHAPPAPVVASVVAQALHGLHAAHEARDERGEPLAIVHRDISPHNVLVGVDGVARVLDFGVAKAIGRASITREGELKGKLPYMAPEQLRRGQGVTRRTDVYAAGVVLWEGLAAKRLFEGAGEAEILTSVLDGAPHPPSAFERGIPRALDDIVMRALARDPDERFESARDMALAIEAAVGVTATADIGAWVSSLAAAGIAKRAEVVASIESSSELSTSQTTGSGMQTLSRVLGDGSQAMRDERMDETATRPIVHEPATIDSPSRPRRRVGALVALIVVLVSALVVSLVWPGRRLPQGPASPASTSSGAGTTTATASAPAQTVTELALPEPTPPPTTVPAPAATKSTQPIKHPPPTHKESCNPPFFYENGIKKFKQQCL